MMENQNKSFFSYLSLIHYIHLDYFIINQGCYSHDEIYAILCGVKYIIEGIDYQKKIKIKISNKYLNTILDCKINFYVGIVLVNFLILRRTINESKKYSWFLY